MPATTTKSQTRATRRADLLDSYRQGKINLNTLIAEIISLDRSSIQQVTSRIDSRRVSNTIRNAFTEGNRRVALSAPLRVSPQDPVATEQIAHALGFGHTAFLQALQQNQAGSAHLAANRSHPAGSLPSTASDQSSLVQRPQGPSPPRPAGHLTTIPTSWPSRPSGGSSENPE